MAKNDYLDRQRKAKQAVLDVGEEMGMQKMWDYLSIVLTDPEVMSTHVLTKERLKMVHAAAKKLSDHYHTAFTDDKEADYRQEELDGQLREIWGGELYTFFDRYPHIKKLDYTKSRKSWR